MKERVLWQIDVFDRIVLRGFRLRRQQLFANVESGLCTWRDVKLIPRLRKK
jgi:hypothetical protein